MKYIIWKVGATKRVAKWEDIKNILRKTIKHCNHDTLNKTPGLH